MLPIRIYPEYAIILKYDIMPGVQEQYFRFVTSDFLPALQRRRIYMQNAWHILYGDQPERQVELITEELGIIRELFDDPEWKDLEGRLKDYIENYTIRVVKYSGPLKI